MFNVEKENLEEVLQKLRVLEFHIEIILDTFNIFIKLHGISHECENLFVAPLKVFLYLKWFMYSQGSKL